MAVLIDADACPVTDIAIRLCAKYGVSCILFCDTAHQLFPPEAETVLCDKGADSSDFVLVNRTSAADIVITQDYGLASMCLARGARVLHQDGWEYTPYNIDALLFQRHQAQKLRSAGGRTKGPKKRLPNQNQAFSKALENILQGAFSSGS